MPDIETLRRILGERCYPSLADIGHEVDMVGVFRRAEDVMPVARQAIEIGAKALWQQFGVANLEGPTGRRASTSSTRCWTAS
ncbi:MAG: hypothetical protein ABS56_11540 [Lautropia sp. SCN 69-89]|nr:MAG: hypothetical protein ABS56_11540 [Lautropia sp. SCN 69-89]